MFKIRSEHILLLFNKIIYITLLGIGCYFIRQGDVIGKFEAKGTNYLIYDEKITEFPTIVTYLWPPKPNLIYARDFNITFQAIGYSVGINLTDGKNIVPGTGLIVDFHEMGMSFFQSKLTANNFLPHMQLDYSLTYSFENESTMARSQAAISFTTENNTLTCHGGIYFDGDVDPLSSDLGQDNYIVISPVKFIYSKQQRKCRQSPYGSKIVEFFEKNYFENCSNPCRPEHFLDTCEALTQSKLTKQLPVCKKDEDLACFSNIVTTARETILEQPCTKLSYRYKNSAYYSERLKVVHFKMNYANPHKVIVNKEYLVYDLVGMISSIGGTLGLCIGFSFSQLANTLMRCLKTAFAYIKRHYHKIIQQP